MNGQHHGRSHSSSLSLRKETYNSANYRTISLIGHGSKVMLKIILNRLKPQAEEIIAEEQAGFRSGRSTIEQIFNLRILCEKYSQHQQDIYHVFIDFKKAFDRVWHDALWDTMKKYNMGQKLINIIKQLYAKASSAVLAQKETGSIRRSESVRDVYSHQLCSTSTLNA